MYQHPSEFTASEEPETRLPIYKLFIDVLPILDQLKRERHLQSPQDVYHLTAGKVQRFLKITTEALLLEGKEEFMRVWKFFEYPKTYQIQYLTLTVHDVGYN